MSRKRRDMLRRTWAPAGRLGEVEAEHGVRIRFFVGYSRKRSADPAEAELLKEMKEVGGLELLF